MADQTLLIIRHGEKPEAGGDSGVDRTGVSDPRSLTPRGWQRAGTWAELFTPSLGQRPPLPKPAAIFASAPASHEEIKAGDGGSKSRRPLETVALLAAKLGIQIDLRFGKGNETDLAAAVSKVAGVVLVCWQHEDIAAIANALTPAPSGIPVNWPKERFNVIFRFDRSDAGSPWKFQQIVPGMLDGDLLTPI